MTLTKRCSRCQTDLPNTLSYYGPDAKGRDGLRTVCRECRSKSNAAWRKRNPESVKRSATKFREKNRERIREEARRRYAAEREILARLRQANGQEGSGRSSSS